MGFFASYKRLSKYQKIGIGVSGMLMGLVGPYITDYFKMFLETESKNDESKREHLKKDIQHQREDIFGK